MPGLVNCHTHSAMTGLRGIRDDSNSMNGLMTISGQQKQDLPRHDDYKSG